MEEGLVPLHDVLDAVSGAALTEVLGVRWLDISLIECVDNVTWIVPFIELASMLKVWRPGQDLSPDWMNKCYPCFPLCPSCCCKETSLKSHCKSL